MKQNVKNLLNLMKEKYKVNSLEALSEKLEITLSGVEAWKRRDNIPIEYLLKFLERTDVTADEIRKNGIESANYIEYSQIFCYEELEKLKNLGLENEIENIFIKKAKELNESLKKINDEYKNSKKGSIMEKDKFYVKKDANVIIDRQLTKDWEEIEVENIKSFLDSKGLIWHKDLDEDNAVFVWEEDNLADGKCNGLSACLVEDLNEYSIFVKGLSIKKEDSLLNKNDLEMVAGSVKATKEVFTEHSSEVVEGVLDEIEKSDKKVEQKLNQ